MSRHRIVDFSGGQVNNLGPFAVKESQSRLLLNADLKKRRGALMRRDGYTKIGSAISANPILGLGVLGSGRTPTVNYSAAALPAASTPAWTKTSSGGVSEAVSGGILTTSSNTTAGSQQYYELADTDLDATVGITVEFKLKVGTLTTDGQEILVAIGGGSKNATVQFAKNGGVYYVWLYSLYGTASVAYTFNPTDGYHIYRLTLKDSIARFYIDSVLVLTNTNMSDTGWPGVNQGVGFGDYASNTIAHTEYWDYVKYWQNGAWSPLSDIFVVANSGNLYEWLDPSFTSLSQTLAAGQTVNAVEFNSKLFVANGEDAPRTYSGDAVATTGDAANAPVFKYVERFFDRIYGAYSDTYPDTLWWSSLPMDLITNVNGAHTTATTLTVASTKYIKVGDKIDTYTHATSSKVATGGDSNSVTAVPSETTLTVSSITCADNDDVYIEDTKGTLGLKWDTSGLPAADYEKFPGETLVGLKRYGDYLVIGAKTSMWALDKYQNKTQVSATAGTTAGRSMAVVNGQFFYFNQLGIYRWTGAGEPELISTPIQDFIDAVGTSFLTSVVGFADQDSYCLYVDALTVANRTYSNVLIEFNMLTENFILHTLQDTITCATTYAPPPGDTKYVYFGTSDGELMRWRNGTSDNGSVIYLEAETIDYFITGPEDVKQVGPIWVAATTPGRVSLEVSVDDGEFKSLGDIKNNVTKIICNLVGSYFKFRIVHAETVSPQIDAIILNYKLQGEKQ